MTISNGYCTLAELKERLQNARRYTAATLAFASSTKKITDTAKRLKRFQDGMLIDISGSLSNDGTYMIATGDAAGEIVVEEALTTEAAGRTVTITDIADPVDDAALEAVIEGASRAIDGMTLRKFHLNAVDETRYFQADELYELWVDDLVSVTTLMTDSDWDGTAETTWTTAQFELWPPNAALDGEPYCRIDVTQASGLSWPLKLKRGVKITGKFGYPATPKPIKEACLILAARLFSRKDAVFGTVGSGEFQKDLAEIDPDVKRLLTPFMRRT